MAACAITTTGTSGKVLLTYTESAVVKSAIVPIGVIYLDDATVTDVKWTTLYGDAVSASSCFVETEVPMSCYRVSWDYSDLVGYSFVSVILDGEEIAIPEIAFPNAGFGLAGAVNGLGDDRIKIVKGKITESPSPTNYSMIAKTITVNPPIFKIASPDDVDFLLIEGIASTCSPVGYEDFNTCQPIILP